MKHENGSPQPHSMAKHGQLYTALMALKAGGNRCVRLETAAEHYACHSVMALLKKKENLRFRRQVHGTSVLVWKKAST